MEGVHFLKPAVCQDLRFLWQCCRKFKSCRIWHGFLHP